MNGDVVFTAETQRQQRYSVVFLCDFLGLCG